VKRHQRERLCSISSERAKPSLPSLGCEFLRLFLPIHVMTFRVILQFWAVPWFIAVTYVFLHNVSYTLLRLS
jgi:hypothetical protein